MSALVKCRSNARHITECLAILLTVRREIESSQAHVIIKCGE